MSAVVGGGSVRAGAAVRRDDIRPLTGLRGVAAWWVVLFHFNEFLPAVLHGWIGSLMAKGYLAVDLFFVLSGFIIAYNYLDRFSVFDLRTYLHFLGVRLARIYPLHLFMLVAFLVNPLAIHLAASQGIDAVRYDPLYYIQSLFLIQNWGFTEKLAWNVPAWSISAEWMAYLLFPPIAWIAHRFARTIAGAITSVLAVLAVLAIGLEWMGETLGGDIPRNGLIRCLCEFMAGALLYRVWVLAHRKTVFVVAAAGSMAGSVGAFAYFDVPDVWTMPAAWACGVFLFAARPDAFSILFSNRVMETIGLWSYSTYLAHYFVRDWVKFLLMRDEVSAWLQLACYIGGTAVASCLLYRLIEVPGRQAFRALADRRLGLASR